MPIWKFRELADAEAHLDALPTTADASVRTALFLLTLSEAHRRGIRTALLGLHRYADHQEAEAARERHALCKLQAAGPEAIPPASDRR